MVDLALREVRDPATRRLRRITPKSIAVLLVLVEHAGKVVTRDTLMARAWPDTLPTDDVITQAITQLRKAFGEERGERQAGVRYIETIAKTGYRLVAPVTWRDIPSPVATGVEIGSEGYTSVDTAEFPALPLEGLSPAQRPGAGAGLTGEGQQGLKSMPPKRAMSRSRWLGAAAAVVAALMLGFWLKSTREEASPAAEIPTRHQVAVVPPAAPALPYRLLTSAPGFEMSPTLSPDAAMVAYSASLPERRGTVILVQTTDQALPRQLTSPVDGVSDRVPAWSPDGREIAFMRAGPGRKCQILLIPASGGTERRVSDCDSRDLLSFDWAPDGRSLLFGSMHAGHALVGIRLLDLATGQWRHLAYDSSQADLDYNPRYSPDGRWIVFARNPQLGDLWRIPAGGGRVERLTTQGGEIRGWDWLPDGRGLVFGRRIGSETRLYQLDMDTRAVHDLGVDSGQSPTIAPRAGMMAFVRRQPQFGIFRIPRDFDAGADSAGKSGSLPYEHLFASSGRDTQPRIAPDGRQLVFTSNRSGEFGLWWADLRTPETLRLLDGIRPETRSIPMWSRDSRRLLVVGADLAGVTGVHEIEPASGQISRLPVPAGNPIQADYLPNPEQMLVTERLESGHIRVTIYDRSFRPWRALGRLDDVSLAKVDEANGRIFFTRLSDDGLWQSDLALSPRSVMQVSLDLPSRWRFQSWALAEDGTVDYLDALRGCLTSLQPIVAVGRASAEAGSSLPMSGIGSQGGVCLDPDRLASTTGFSISSTRNAVFVALAVSDGTDIAYMPIRTGPAAPPVAGVPGWFN